MLSDLPQCVFPDWLLNEKLTRILFTTSLLEASVWLILSLHLSPLFVVLFSDLFYFY